MSGKRYAIYYAPRAGSPLWRFGSAVLGYDAATGEEVPFAVPPGFPEGDWPSLTAEPRRYGFHATLKAPFELARGRDEDELRAFAHNEALNLAPATLDGLEVAALGRFVALVPARESEALQRLAFALVQAFEPFRAPLSEADMARRLRAPLTPAQHVLLESHGYPYVGDEFRFHMTLTGPLPAESVAPVAAALERAYVDAVPQGPVTIDRFAIFRQETRESRFHLLDGFGLG